MAKKLTITMTNYPPVTVDEELWPIIASAKDYDSRIESQANRTWMMKVRRHADGRAIVYATYTSAYPEDRDKRAGLLVDPDGDIPHTINRVAELMGWETCPGSVAANCIADLPAQAI